MAHKTFISYKHSDAEKLRDDIIDTLGDDATYYKGERPESPDLTDENSELIKQMLRDKMYDTSVTIVIISPNMKKSKWIDWELEYCLKKIKRGERTSHANGIVGVIMKVNDGYDWFKSVSQNIDGCYVTSYKTHLLFDIINNNRFNQIPKQYTCNRCKLIDELDGCYISFIEEERFLNDHTKYIENAFEKSEYDAVDYVLVKERNGSKVA